MLRDDGLKHGERHAGSLNARLHCARSWRRTPVQCDASTAIERRRKLEHEIFGGIEGEAGHVAAQFDKRDVEPCDLIAQ